MQHLSFHEALSIFSQKLDIPSLVQPRGDSVCLNIDDYRIHIHPHNRSFFYFQAIIRIFNDQTEAQEAPWAEWLNINRIRMHNNNGCLAWAPDTLTLSLYRMVQLESAQPQGLLDSLENFVNAVAFWVKICSKNITSQPDFNRESFFFP